MSEHVQEFTDASFSADVLKASAPVLVDFWAPWCGPCRQIAPVIDQLAQEYAGKVVVGKVNLDDSPQAAQMYGIHSIPTLLLFKNGEVVERIVGVPQKSRLNSILDSAI